MSCTVRKMSYGKKIHRKSKSKMNKKSKRKHLKGKRRFGQPPMPQQAVRLNFSGKRKSKMSKKSKSKSKQRKSFLRRFRNPLFFGKMPDGQQIMGNFRPPAKMDTYQEYTGMGPSQAVQHLAGIPLELRSNFYSDV